MHSDVHRVRITGALSIEGHVRSLAVFERHEALTSEVRNRTREK